MTRIDLDALTEAPPQMQLVVLLRAIEALRATAVEATRVYLAVGGKREDLRALEAEIERAAV